MHLDSGTLTPVIKKLEEKGLIVRYRSTEDDRIVIVELAENGRLLKEDILEVPEKMYCNFKGNEETLIMLKKYLDEMLNKSFE